MGGGGAEERLGELSSQPPSMPSVLHGIQTLFMDMGEPVLPRPGRNGQRLTGGRGFSFLTHLETLLDR